MDDFPANVYSLFQVVAFSIQSASVQVLDGSGRSLVNCLRVLMADNVLRACPVEYEPYISSDCESVVIQRAKETTLTPRIRATV